MFSGIADAKDEDEATLFAAGTDFELGIGVIIGVHGRLGLRAFLESVVVVGGGRLLLNESSNFVLLTVSGGLGSSS